jgi:serine/threonine-protein kinase
VVPLADTKFQETTPTVSPDGRWLAYASDETGRPEVYIRPFPDVGRGKWLVSAEGGTEPRFSRNGSELFYRNGKGEMVAAEVAPGSTPPIGRQRALFSAAAYSANAYHQLYDVAPDGRFLMLRQGGDTTAASTRLFVVENFLEDVKAKMTK